MIYEDGKITVAQIMDDVLAAGYAETIKRGVISAAETSPGQRSGTCTRRRTWMVR